MFVEKDFNVWTYLTYERVKTEIYYVRVAIWIRQFH